MKKISIQIIEDNAEEAEKLRRYLEKCNYEVSGIADNLKDALGLFYAQKPDMVIVDIFLQDKPDGIVFAEKINENHTTRKPFVFLTGATDRNTFEVAKLTAPFSYLLKPFNELELLYAIELAVEKFANEIGVFSSEQYPYVIINESFFIKKRDFLVKVPVNSITHIEVKGKYLSIYSDSNSFLVQLSLTELLRRLPEKQFIRVNRSVAVNLDKVVSISTVDDQMILDNDKKILISRRNKESIIKSFNVLK